MKIISPFILPNLVFLEIINKEWLAVYLSFNTELLKKNILMQNITCVLKLRRFWGIIRQALQFKKFQLKTSVNN